jgi:hypothetical protein
VVIAQVRSDDDSLGGTFGVQQEHLEWIAEIIVIELVVADSVKPHFRPAATMAALLRSRFAA